ncbi:MAG TPA: PAS domain-containing protein, partial [Brevibacillus sp.]|nr:PAS domain-containing protein [Brevibacillus sp.]
MVSNWFTRKAFIVSLDSALNEVWNIMSLHNEPFVFIESKEQAGKIFAYIQSTDIMPLVSDAEWMKRQVHQLPFHTELAFLDEEADMLDFFKFFGEEVVVILGRDGSYKGYLRREDMLYHLLTNQSGHTDWIRSLLNSIPMGLIITDVQGKIENFSSEALRMIRLSPDELRNGRIGDILDQDKFKKVIEHGESILNDIIINERMGVLADFGPIRNQHGAITGAIIVLQDLPYIENLAMELEYVKNLNTDLQGILSSIYDEILVLDAKGVLL